MKIKAIRCTGFSDVFNLEVESTHDFAVESGIIVHNCYDQVRYVAMQNPISPRPHTPPKLIVFDPLTAEPAAYAPYEFFRRL